MDWDDAFDNTGYVPGAKDLAQGWAQQAQVFRQSARGDLDLSYGTDPRHVLDLFHPQNGEESKGLFVFVHGGYWRLFDKSYWSHLAAGALAQGWSVAVPSYPLAPQARISEITASIKAAVEFAAAQVPGPIRLAGHSAGGHLVARMACAGVLTGEVGSRLARVVPISGVLDLVPLLNTQMNLDLRLTEDEAKAESPVLLDPRPGVPLTFWVGAEERPEFLRQNRMGTERWGLKGADVHSVYDAGHHHFSVIADLEHAQSALTREVLR